MRLGSDLADFGSSWRPLGVALGLSWALLGPSWGLLGPLGDVLGPSCGRLGDLLGALGALLEPLGAVKFSYVKLSYVMLKLSSVKRRFLRHLRCVFAIFNRELIGSQPREGAGRRGGGKEPSPHREDIKDQLHSTSKKVSLRGPI